MISTGGEREGSPAATAPGGRIRPSSAVAFALVFALLFPTILLACTQESSTFGQYRKGRTLHFSVISLERTPELRYSTIDPNGVVRKWSLSSSSADSELILVRARVENHTAVSAIINVDKTAAELRDFANATYRPLSVTEEVWQDFRGETEAVVKMDLGQCYDGTRSLVDTGSTVKWESEFDDEQYVQFQNPSVQFGNGGPVEIGPGQSASHTFNNAGEFLYTCSAPDVPQYPAALRVADPDLDTDYIDRSTLFIRGSFELLQGHGLDGFMVFEAPVGTEFRDMRWRAGDSITFGF